MYRGHFRTMSLGFAFLCVGRDVGSGWAVMIGFAYVLIGFAQWDAYLGQSPKTPGNSAGGEKTE